MAYRTYVNDVQLFGNNDAYEPWTTFIESQGIKIGDDGQYEGEIHDFNAAIAACERIVEDIEAERVERRTTLRRLNENPNDEFETWLDRQAASLFDLSGIPRDIERQRTEGLSYRDSLFDKLFELSEDGYLFLPVKLYRICQLDVRFRYGGDPNRTRSFEIIPGHTIRVRAG